METLRTGLFLIAAAINLAPTLGLLGASRLQSLYGLGATVFDDPNLLILMRHRAVLFGIVGGLLVAGAFLPSARIPAVICGLFSMISFVLIAWATPEMNEELKRIVWIDLVGIIALAGAYFADRLISSRGV